MLVVGEVGYLACSDDAANVLYHVVNDRHIRRRAMIFTTNKHPKPLFDSAREVDRAPRWIAARRRPEEAAYQYV